MEDEGEKQAIDHFKNIKKKKKKEKGKSKGKNQGIPSQDIKQDEPQHPGPINQSSQTQKILINNDAGGDYKYNKFMPFYDCLYNGRVLKPDSEITEDVDYKLLND